MTDVWCVYPTETFFVPYNMPKPPASWAPPQNGTATFDLGHHDSNPPLTGCPLPGNRAETTSVIADVSEQPRITNSATGSDDSLLLSSELATKAQTLHQPPASLVTSTLNTTATRTTSESAHGSSISLGTSLPTCYPDGEKFLLNVNGTDKSEGFIATLAHAAVLIFRHYMKTVHLTRNTITYMTSINAAKNYVHFLRVDIDDKCTSCEIPIYPPAPIFIDNLKLCKAS